MADLTKEFKQLQASPFYNLSLSSKELFHTNFLAWIFKTYPETLRDCFNSHLKGRSLNNVKIEREKYNIDLIIKIDDLALFIENKVKDTPKKNQLRNYNKTIDEKYEYKDKDKGIKYEHVKIILSLFPARKNLSEETGWRYFSYENLYKSLEKSKLDNLNHQVMLDEYLKMIKIMTVICSELVKEDTVHWFDFKDKEPEENKLIKGLSDIKFDDVYKKYIASIFLDNYESNFSLKSTDPLKNYTNTKDLKKCEYNKVFKSFSYSLANKNPNIHLSLGKNTKEFWFTIGIQIEGHQYRYFIETNAIDLEKVSADKDISGLLEQYQLGTWINASYYKDNKQYCRKQGEEYSSKSTKKFNRYAPNFIYQYIDIGEKPMNVKPKDLYRMINEDLKTAHSILDKI